MNESKPVISPIARQTWTVGEDFKVEVPISNNPDQAWAWGELYGGGVGSWEKDKGVLMIKEHKEKSGHFIGSWDPDIGVLTVKGHADKEKSGHFIVFAKKGSCEVQHTVYYDAVLP